MLVSDLTTGTLSGLTNGIVTAFCTFPDEGSGPSVAVRAMEAQGLLDPVQCLVLGNHVIDTGQQAAIRPSGPQQITFIIGAPGQIPVQPSSPVPVLEALARINDFCTAIGVTVNQLAMSVHRTP